MQADTPILGFLEASSGRVAVYGDSNCLDSSHMVTNCYWLLKKILEFTSKNIKDPVLFSDSVKQDKPLHLEDNQLPSRRTDVNFSTYSAVVGKELICRSDSRFEVWGTKGYSLHSSGRNRKLPGYPVNDLSRNLSFDLEISGTKSLEAAKNYKLDLSDKYLGLFNRDDVRSFKLLLQSYFLFMTWTCLL